MAKKLRQNSNVKQASRFMKTVYNPFILWGHVQTRPINVLEPFSLYSV